MHGITDEQNYVDIANAIREKNGSDTQYLPSEMADAIGALAVGKLDWNGNLELSEMLNSYFSEEIKAHEELTAPYKNATSLKEAFYKNRNIRYYPHDTTHITNMDYTFSNSGIRFFENINFENVIHANWCLGENTFIFITSQNVFLNFKNATSCHSFLRNASSQAKYSEVKFIINTGWKSDKPASLDLGYFFHTHKNKDYTPSFEILGDRCNNLDTFDYYCTSIDSLIYLNSYNLSKIRNITKVSNIKLGSIENITTDFTIVSDINSIEFDRWKKYGVSLNYASSLPPQYINYIIEHALGEADGAVARTLYLHATAKANWMNVELNPDYEYYQAMATEKLITIA